MKGDKKNEMVLIELLTVSLVIATLIVICVYETKQVRQLELSLRKEYPYLAFDQVTEHFGYTYEFYHGKWRVLIWRHINGVKGNVVIAKPKSINDAIKECYYLEHLEERIFNTKKETKNEN